MPPPLSPLLVFGVNSCHTDDSQPHFGYIYGFGLFGCIATAMVLNLIGEKPIDLWKTTRCVVSVSLPPANPPSTHLLPPPRPPTLLINLIIARSTPCLFGTFRRFCFHQNPSRVGLRNTLVRSSRPALEGRVHCSYRCACQL